jgi:hypothetical protein
VSTPVRWLVTCAGLVVGGLVLLCGGFVVVAADCTGDYGPSPSGLCRHFSQLVTPLELCLLALGTLAPPAGAVAAIAEHRVRWLGYGSAAGAAVLLLLTGLAGEQASLLSY